MSQQFQLPTQTPDKIYFRIGEVSNLVGVEAHVLRYWESEFKEINPRRTRSGQRLYRKQDVELLIRIKSLLHEQGYTINGARKFLVSGKKTAPGDAKTGTLPLASNSQLAIIKNELKKIRDILARAAKAR